MTETPSYNPRIHWFALVTCVATLGLIGVGGVVTSTGVGMAVPDWPNTYGYNMFFFPFSQWVGGILWEHSHRLFASGVGLLTLILCLWTFGRPARGALRWVLVPLSGGGALVSWKTGRFQDAAFLGGVCLVALAVSFVWPRCRPSRPLLKIMGVVALVGVIGQGILGGLRVTLFADQIGIIHAAIAQLFFVLLCGFTLVSSRWWSRLGQQSRPEKVSRVIGWGMGVLTLMVLFQLVLGASMRHQHAGLAVTEFPLVAYGKLWPATDEASIDKLNRERVDHREFEPITKNQILLHMAHRMMALSLFLAAGIWTWVCVRKEPKGHLVGSLMIVWFSMICVQALLGAATVWSNKAADIATLHVVLGALTLALGALSSMIALRLAQSIPAGVSTSVSSYPDLASVAERPSAGVV